MVGREEKNREKNRIRKKQPHKFSKFYANIVWTSRIITLQTQYISTKIISRKNPSYSDYCFSGVAQYNQS